MSERRRLRTAVGVPTSVTASSMPDELAVFRPVDWQQPGDVDHWPAWRRHKTAFLDWTDAHDWTRRQAIGFLHPSWIAYGWADEPPFRRSAWPA